MNWIRLIDLLITELNLPSSPNISTLLSQIDPLSWDQSLLDAVIELGFQPEHISDASLNINWNQLKQSGISGNASVLYPAAYNRVLEMVPS